MPRGLFGSLKEAWEVPRDLVLRRYPPFVTGGPLPRGDIPVFVLHGAEPGRLERQLRHLEANGYRTLSTDEYLQTLEGARPAPERAVVLTFDDGRGSVWTVAAPLLRRFGMKAVVFLVPGRMGSRPPTPTLEDVDAGRVPAAEIEGREAGEEALLSWEEVESLSRTGLVDFQSHTLTHARVHTAPRLAGFVTPSSRRGYEAFDQPLIHEGDRDLLGEEVPLGTPLFRSASRISEALRFFEDPSVRRACTDVVAGHGETFFGRPDWERTLRSRMARVAVGGRRETPQEKARAIEHELVESRRLIQEHTGRPVDCLCYPWHDFGPTAREIARAAGFRAAFCGKVTGVSLTRAGGDLERIARIGEDYLELLPGKGRSTLAEVLSRKWTRRFGPGA
jgi:peptidoglycan/xylan/chitin deacetylase (PgdA/CDA1 family)